MNRKAFYDAVRTHVGALNTGQVGGFERYLDEGERRGTPLDRLAYIISTVFWETARTMAPVKEAYWKSEGWRKANLRYFPWYGRGDIQLTWEANYVKAGKAIGVDLIKDPDAALDPANAVRIAFEGMEHGWFTGRDLGDYLDGVDESDAEDLREFTNARRIVNGTDKQIEIGKLALAFEGGLRAAGYGATSTKESAMPTPTAGTVPTGSTTSKAKGGAIGTALVGPVLVLFAKFGWIPVAVASDPEAVIILTTIVGAGAAALGAYFAPRNATAAP